MLADLLTRTIHRELTELRAMTEDRALVPPAAGSWSPKEELGHLIDSAANNHIRFVRAALEGTFSGPPYAQNAWVDIHGYQEMPLDELVSLWHSYNALLARVLERIPEDRLAARMTIGSEASVTLAFVIDDYILHMQHHLDHLLGRDEITQYPRPGQTKI